MFTQRKDREYWTLSIIYVCVQEFSVLQINSEGKLKVLESDLQASRSTVTALKDRNKDLGKI